MGTDPAGTLVPAEAALRRFSGSPALSGGGASRRIPLSTWAWAGTSLHFTVYPAPWAQKTESGVFSTSRSGS